jgi:PAS domain S-box-containing protein
MLGYTGANALEGTMLAGLVAAEDRVDLREMLERIEHGEKTSYREFCLLHTQGSEHVAEVSGLNGAYEGEPAGFCVFRDVTERKRLQGKMMQIDRMNAVGTLAAGVAHEINNPLAYVHSNTEYLLTMTSKYRTAHTNEGALSVLSHDDLAEALEDIREGTQRIRSIVSDLSTFSKPDQQSTRPLDVGEVLRSALKMAENQLRHRARIIRDFSEVPAVTASEANLAQVFLNLLVNAAQAIPEGVADENEVAVTTSVDGAGSKVVVEISDTGPGVPEELRGRIFDPFFSTKGQDEGMGLGLFICRNIVRDHGGDISFESIPDVGTTFRVELPAVEARAEPSREFQSPVIKDGLIGRALIIDDEVGVCRTIERVLAGSYRTTSVNSGREALELLGRDQSFAVIICDLLMPDISGVEVNEHLSKHYPRLEERMVFITGGTFTERTNDLVASTSRPIMLKPFNIKEFREVVDSVAQS